MCFRHPGRETTSPPPLRAARVPGLPALRPGGPAVRRLHPGEPRGGGPRPRQARTAFGGRQVVSAPVVTWTLVGINVLLYLAVIARPSIADNLEMVGYAANGRGGAIGVGRGPVVSPDHLGLRGPSGGLGITDIAFNMWALIVVGPPLERMLGSARYLAVYLLSALAGGVFLVLPGGAQSARARRLRGRLRPFRRLVRGVPATGP